MFPLFLKTQPCNLTCASQLKLGLLHCGYGGPHPAAFCFCGIHQLRTVFTFKRKGMSYDRKKFSLNSDLYP